MMPELFQGPRSNTDSALSNLAYASVLGIDIINIDPKLLNDIIIECALNKKKLSISFVNHHSYIMAKQVNKLKEMFMSLDIVGADGIAVILGSHILNCPLKERLSADILAPYMLNSMQIHGLKLFLFGAAPGVAEKTASTIIKNYPNLQIAGLQHGYISSNEDNDLLISKINDSNADIVWIGLGTPLQESWIINNLQYINAPILMTCGGMIHQTANRVKYYPEWAYHYKINWLYRFFDEPQRLWKRYTIELFLFFLMIIKFKLFRNNNYNI